MVPLDISEKRDRQNFETTPRRRERVEDRARGFFWVGNTNIFGKLAIIKNR